MSRISCSRVAGEPPAQPPRCRREVLNCASRRLQDGSALTVATMIFHGLSPPPLLRRQRLRLGGIRRPNALLLIGSTTWTLFSTASIVVADDHRRRSR